MCKGGITCQVLCTSNPPLRCHLEKYGRCASLKHSRRRTQHILVTERNVVNRLFSKYHLHWPLCRTGVSRTEWIRSNPLPCPAIPVPYAYANILALLKTTPNSSFCSQPVIWKQGHPCWCFRKKLVVVWELVCIFTQWATVEGWRAILWSVPFCCLKPCCLRLSLYP